MNIGDMRKRVVIQHKTRTPDGGGGNTVTWSTLATVWANVEPIRPFRSAEYIKGDQLKLFALHKVTIRYRSDVDATMQINIDGRILAIHTLVRIEEGKQRFIEMMCTEGDPS